MPEPAFVCGYAAVAGLPNAGKSTMVNALVGEKVAIVTDKPQTTQARVHGVATLEGGQIVFIDTPGIHRSDSYLNKRMMGAVREALDSPDVRIYITDASREPADSEWQALDTLKRAHAESPRPAILVLNKIDRLPDKRFLLPRIEQFREHHAFEEYIPISALRLIGLEELKKTILKYLPKGKPIFPPEQWTDQPERYLAAEMIREQILKATHREVPHSVAVKVEEWEEKTTLTRIAATITVERPGQKGIVIGAKGAMLKQIGTQARLDIEGLLGRKVLLELFVAVRPGWRDSEGFVNELDWRTTT